MQQKPKIKIKLSAGDIAFEIAGWLLLLSLWMLLAKNYSFLPETIVTHFNGSGQADGFGGKANILILPIIASLIFIGLTIINKFPHQFNYPTNVSGENAEEQYKNATRFIRYIKFVIVFIFSYLTFKTIQIAKQETQDLGAWVLPSLLGLIFIPVVYFIVRSVKMKA